MVIPKCRRLGRAMNKNILEYSMSMRTRKDERCMCINSIHSLFFASQARTNGIVTCIVLRSNCIACYEAAP